MLHNYYGDDDSLKMVAPVILAEYLKWKLSPVLFFQIKTIKYSPMLVDLVFSSEVVVAVVVVDVFFVVVVHWWRMRTFQQMYYRTVNRPNPWLVCIETGPPPID